MLVQNLEDICECGRHWRSGVEEVGDLNDMLEDLSKVSNRADLEMNMDTMKIIDDNQQSNSHVALALVKIGDSTYT